MTTEKLNMDDVDSMDVMEDEFLSMSEVGDETQYPTYDGGVDDKPWPSSFYTTAGGKTIEVYHEEFGTLWGIKFKEGGVMPAELTGKYTSQRDADLDVQLYLAKKEA